MKSFFSFLFPQWEPTLVEGAYYIAKSKELERYYRGENFIVKILPRDKKTAKHYYNVITNDIPIMTDSEHKPINFYIHEKNIIRMCGFNAHN